MRVSAIRRGPGSRRSSPRRSERRAWQQWQRSRFARDRTGSAVSERIPANWQFQRTGATGRERPRTDRTQEVAGSSPASSMSKSPQSGHDVRSLLRLADEAERQAVRGLRAGRESPFGRAGLTRPSEENAPPLRDGAWPSARCQLCEQELRIVAEPDFLRPRWVGRPWRAQLERRPLEADDFLEIDETERRPRALSQVIAERDRLLAKIQRARGPRTPEVAELPRQTLVAEQGARHFIRSALLSRQPSCSVRVISSPASDATATTRRRSSAVRSASRAGSPRARTSSRKSPSTSSRASAAWNAVWVTPPAAGPADAGASRLHPLELRRQALRAERLVPRAKQLEHHPAAVRAPRQRPFE